MKLTEDQLCDILSSAYDEYAEEHICVWPYEGDPPWWGHYCDWLLQNYGIERTPDQMDWRESTVVNEQLFLMRLLQRNM